MVTRRLGKSGILSNIPVDGESFATLTGWQLSKPAGFLKEQVD
jgi:hypothetical protein